MTFRRGIRRACLQAVDQSRAEDLSAAVEEGEPSTERGLRLKRFGLYLLFFFIVLCIQWSAGSFRSELGDQPDEPAHIVSGLLVRDYLAAGMKASPFPYGQDFYLHYPKVAIGHFPPMFYVLQGIWGLIFPSGTTSLLILMACLAAALGLAVFEALAEELEWFAALGLTLAIFTLPIVQESARSIMTELVMALTVTLAVLAFAKFVDTGRARYSVLFGVWASAAILTKASGIELALVPPLTILISRRWDLLRRPALWLSGLIVAGATAPWFLLVPGAQHEAVGRFGTVMVAHWRFTETPVRYFQYLGPIFLALSILGLLDRFAALRRGACSAKWIAAFALIASSYGFRIVLAVWESRHLITATVALGLFAGPGLLSLSRMRLFAGAGRRWSLAVPGVLVAIVVCLNIYNIREKRHHGFDNAARFVASQPQWRDSVILVSSDGLGEGVFVAETAFRDARPQHYVLRSSKVVGQMDWMGAHVRSRFTSPGQLMWALDHLRVGVLILDNSPTARWTGAILAGVEASSGDWQEVLPPQRPDVLPGVRPLRIFQRTGRESYRISEADFRKALRSVIGNSVR